MTGAGTPGPKLEASFGARGEHREGSLPELTLASDRWELSVEAEEVGDGGGEMKEYGERFGGVGGLGTSTGSARITERGRVELSGRYKGRTTEN